MAIERVLNEKTEFVPRNRMRLIRDAERSADEANVRYAQALQAAEKARQEAVETRATVVWTHLFPSEALVSPAPTHLLAGALKPLGLTAQVNVARVWDALRIDAEWLQTAAAPQQRVALEGLAGRPVRTTEQAVFTDSPEGREALQREHREALERHFAQFGTWPG